jgi:hypothetical protein
MIRTFQIRLALVFTSLAWSAGCDRLHAPAAPLREPALSAPARPHPAPVHMIAVDPGVRNVDVLQFLQQAAQADDEEHRIFVFSGNSRDLAPEQIGTLEPAAPEELAGNIRGAGRQALEQQAAAAAAAVREARLRTIVEDLQRVPAPTASLLVENLRAITLLARQQGPATRVTVLTDLLETQVGKLSLERSDPRDPRTRAAFQAHVRAGGGPVGLGRVRIFMPLTIVPGPGLPPMGTARIKALQELWAQVALAGCQVEFKSLQTIRTPTR